MVPKVINALSGHEVLGMLPKREDLLVASVHTDSHLVDAVDAPDGRPSAA